MEKRTFTLELPEYIWKKLDQYGFYYEKNFEADLKQIYKEALKCEKRLQKNRDSDSQA